MTTLKDLARVKALFQARALEMILRNGEAAKPPTPPATAGKD